MTWQLACLNGYNQAYPNNKEVITGLDQKNQKHITWTHSFTAVIGKHHYPRT